MKKPLVVTILLACLLLASIVVGCAKEPSVSYPTINAEQAIDYVQVYGVPALTVEGHTQDDPAIPVGEWAAVYEGDDKWRVQGQVRLGDRDYSTTWVYDGHTISMEKATEISSSYESPRLRRNPDLSLR